MRRARCCAIFAAGGCGGPELADLGNLQALRGYKYVNLPDQVILAAPASGTVVGEISK